MLHRLLAVALTLASAAAGWAADPPPRVVLPPIERQPLATFRQTAAGPDWGVLKLNAPAAWATTKGKGVRVAVLDTGVDTNHPDLRPAIKSPDDVRDFTGSRFGPSDKQGHGTHCSGSVLARGPLPGVAPDADLVAGKVLGDDGSGGVDDIAAGIRWAVSRNVDVISMSLGGAGQDSFIPPALIEAEAAGVIVVAAAGNDGPREGTVGYPGGYRQAVAVAAVDSNLATANFSSRGPAVFVAGPGVNVRSTYPGGQYATMSGTSMATPNIAGVAALWVAAHPEVDKKDRPAKFREAIKAACLDLAPPGRDTATGWGFPDAAKMVAGGVTPPPPPVVPAPVEITITLDDLTADKRAALLAAGLTGWKQTLTVSPPAAPKSDTGESLNGRGLRPDGRIGGAGLRPARGPGQEIGKPLKSVIVADDGKDSTGVPLSRITLAFGDETAVVPVDTLGPWNPNAAGRVRIGWEYASGQYAANWWKYVGAKNPGKWRVVVDPEYQKSTDFVIVASDKLTDEEEYGMAYALSSSQNYRTILAVGQTYVGAYMDVYYVPSGYKGLKDGVYDCQPDDNNEPVMYRRPDPERLPKASKPLPAGFVNPVQPPLPMPARFFGGMFGGGGGCANGQCGRPTGLFR